jgi:hypothetical protein
MAFKRVLKVYSNGHRKICLIHISGPIIDEQCGGPMYRSPMGVTGEHPFWVQGKGWTPVRELTPGDEFLTEDGRPVTVTRVEIDRTKAEVFNLEVEDFNTYFVDVGIWVHNCNNRLKGAVVGQLFVKQVEYLKPEWSPFFKNGGGVAGSGLPKGEEVIPVRFHGIGELPPMLLGMSM